MNNSTKYKTIFNFLVSADNHLFFNISTVKVSFVLVDSLNLDMHYIGYAIYSVSQRAIPLVTTLSVRKFYFVEEIIYFSLIFNMFCTYRTQIYILEIRNFLLNFQWESFIYKDYYIKLKPKSYLYDKINIWQKIKYFRIPLLLKKNVKAVTNL